MTLKGPGIGFMGDLFGVKLYSSKYAPQGTAFMINEVDFARTLAALREERFREDLHDSLIPCWPDSLDPKGNECFRRATRALRRRLGRGSG